TYNSTDFQKLQDGSTNSFKEAGFNNRLSYQLIDPYIGFQYKFKLGKFIFKPGLFYHYYKWRVDQFGQRLTDAHKGVFLPEFHAEYELHGDEIELDYNLKANFASASKYATRLRLTSFNTLYRGNADLENALYHDLSLHYRTFNRLRGLNYNIRFNYKHQAKSIRN